LKKGDFLEWFMSLSKLSVAVALVGLALGIAPARAALVDGPISVYNAAGTTLLGYVSDTYDAQNSFTYIPIGTLTTADDLQVQINTSASSPFSILELNPPSTNDYFAGVGGSGGYDFTSSSAGYAYLSSSAQTSAGATPQSVATDLNSLSYFGPAESAIWSLSGNVLNATWVNADSTTDAAQTFYDPVVNYLGLVSNLSDYNSAYGDGAYAVKLEVSVPEPSTAGIALGAAAMLMLSRPRRKPHVG
jgi:hypothetical protein